MRVMKSELVAKPVFIAALVAGITYLLGMNLALSPALMSAWKGAGVALLAFWAALNARDLDGWLIVGVMTCGALGDVLLEALALGIIGLAIAGGAFLIGHVIAMFLYFRNWRPCITFSQRLLSALVVPLSVLIVFLLTQEVWAGVYTFFVAGMAASAWTSRFPRYQTGIGAMMFLVSDLLIFARMSVLEESMAVSFAIWAFYFIGQVLILTGVLGSLRGPGVDASVEDQSPATS
jgi:uncharacterized membrane protein YhhN